MEKAIYKNCRKIEDGIVIKSGCNFDQISKFGLELLSMYAEKNFVYSKNGGKNFKDFVNSLIISKISSKDRFHYKTWITNKKHMVSVWRNKENNTFDIIIGKDKSNTFYPMIKKVADDIIFLPSNDGVPEDFPRYDYYFAVEDKISLISAICFHYILKCIHNGNTYYFYKDSDYCHINIDMLLYGEWYMYI